jgi:hypothetical protein
VFDVIEKERLEKARIKIGEIIRKRQEERARRVLVPPPRYDDEFFEGVAWLDSLAGESIPVGQFELIIDQSIGENVNNSHIELSLHKIRKIFQKASERLDALKPGEKVTATALAKELGDELGIAGAQLYPTLSFLFKDYPGILVIRGSHGGLKKL